MTQSKLCLINPSAIYHEGCYYVLLRGESYPYDQGPVFPNLALSTFSYWLHKYDANFNLLHSSPIELTFKKYTYTELKREDLGLSGSKGILEDIRLIPDTVNLNSDGDLCGLGTYSLTCQSQDSVSVVSLGPFRAAACHINLSKSTVRHLCVLSEESQVGMEKNWACVLINNFYYLIRSFFPLDVCRTIDLPSASFGSHEFHPPDYRISAHPIRLNHSHYLGLCHRRLSQESGVNDYQYYFFKFKIVNDFIFIDSPLLPVTLPESGLYCSSMCKNNEKIILFAGRNDLDFSIIHLPLPKFQ